MMILIALASVLLGWMFAWVVRGAKAAAAEARVEELRRQIDAARQGFDGLRAKLEESETARVTAETRAVEIEKRLEEERGLLDEARTKLTDAFTSLASEALAKNNQGFLTLAEEKFKALKETAETDLAGRHEAIDALVKPLEKALTDYRQEARDLEQARQKELGSVGQQLSDVAAAQTALQHETSRLVGALSSAQVRGRWGEITLRRCAELAGLTQYDLTEQTSTMTEDGRVRPDMIVHMPSNRRIVVDSKVPFDGYDASSKEGITDAERAAALDQHAASINQHVQLLSSKEYSNAFSSAEFVVMFIPNDSFLAAAVQRDRKLVDMALQRGVVIATPSTLYALFRVVEQGWQQQKLADNERRISKVGQDLCDRLANFIKHLEAIGKALASATKSYHEASGSYNRLLLPKAREFKLLGAGGTKEIKELQMFDALAEPPVIEPSVENNAPLAPIEEGSES